MALAAAAILAGCSKNEQENVDGFTPKQIKFTNLNDKLTRAANDGNDPYRVYAAWSGGTGWFINDQVSASDVPSGGPYYWPASGSVDFYAWAPADVAATGAYPALSIAYEVPANANKDFTIAAPQLGLTSGTVGLAFSICWPRSPLQPNCMMTCQMLATNSAQQGLLPVWMFNRQEEQSIRRPLLPHGPLLIQRLQPMQEQRLT